MSHGPPEEVDRQRLRELTLSDLIAMSDEDGTEAVEEFLATGLEVASEFLAEHGKHLASDPKIVYEPMTSGVSYDPYHDEGEVLVIGGPRGMLRGGEEVLRQRGLLTQKSLLSILCKGLLHSYNNQLVIEHFEKYGASERNADRGGIELYDKFQMVSPAVDEGITQLFVLYLNGDVTDTELRNEYIQEWIEWYRRRDFDTPLFSAVAYTIGDRIEEAEGTEQERFVHAMEIVEPLIREGDVSVLSGTPQDRGPQPR